MKEAEVTWDEFPEAQEWQSNRWTWRGRRTESDKTPDLEMSPDVEVQEGRKYFKR